MFKKMLVVMLSFALLFGGFTAQVSASIISTQEAMSVENRQARVAEVQELMSREHVREAMVRLGADPEQAQLRVASLSDAELMEVHGQLDQLPAGGALAVIGIVFVVLLILDLTGVINIFRR